LEWPPGKIPIPPPKMKPPPSIPHPPPEQAQGCPPHFPLHFPPLEQLSGHPIKDPLCLEQTGPPIQNEYWQKKHPLWPRKTHFPKGWLGGGAVGGEKRGRKCVCQKQPTYNPFDVRHVSLYSADKALRCAWKHRVLSGREWTENKRCRDQKCHESVFFNNRWPFRPTHPCDCPKCPYAEK
jgi:hypothetical protein